MSSMSNDKLLGNSLLSIVAFCLGAGIAYMVQENKSKKQADEAREEGHKHGCKEGEIAAMKRLRDKMQARNKLKLGVFALGYYIANIDGEFTEEEQAAIDQAIGRPDTVWVDVGFQEQADKIMKEIREHQIGFRDIREEYLNDIDKETFEDLNEVVTSVIHADGKVAKEEQYFLDYEWETLRCCYV